jgi:hypothetical protein
MALLCMSRPTSNLSIETQSDWGYSLGGYLGYRHLSPPRPLCKHGGILVASQWDIICTRGAHQLTRREAAQAPGSWPCARPPVPWLPTLEPPAALGCIAAAHMRVCVSVRAGVGEWKGATGLFSAAPDPLMGSEWSKMTKEQQEAANKAGKK